MTELHPIGIIGNPHGYNGTLKLRPINGEQVPKVKVPSTGYLIDKSGKSRSMTIDDIKRYTHGWYLVRLNGFKNRNDVIYFKNLTLAISMEIQDEYEDTIPPCCLYGGRVWL